MRWHFLQTPPSAGAYNMALDEALMRRAGRTGDAFFRVYGWSSPTLSLGRNQRAVGCYDEEAAGRLGVSFVRRPTGGRALLHHREVTYSVSLPARDASAAGSAYSSINEVLLDGLARLGVEASRAKATAPVPPGLRPCFDVPSEHEIVVGGRKLVGSAQWRRGGALLQHGSILIRDDQSLIAQLLRERQDAGASAATLGESLGWDPAIGDVADVLRAALEARSGTEPGELRLDDIDASELAELSRAYVDEAWTWRR